MGLARGIERRLEQLVDGIASRLFRGRIHPVELGSRLIREADLAVQDGPTGPVAPNLFTVVLGGDPADDESLGTVQAELEAVIEETAAERGWRLEGPARVQIQVAPGRESAVSVEAVVAPGERTPWARLLPSDGGSPIPVGYQRSVVGRGSDSDIHVGTAEVSRRHALLWREVGRVWLYDLESANGTFLNGDRIGDTVEVVDGDILTFGSSSFVYRMV